MKKADIIRGDSFRFFFSMEEAFYKPNTTVYFTAKPELDNDTTNSKAVINKSVSEVKKSNGKVYWEFQLDPSDTQSIPLEDDKLELQAQFEVRYADGRVHTFPTAPAAPIKLYVHPDVKVG